MLWVLKDGSAMTLASQQELWPSIVRHCTIPHYKAEGLFTWKQLKVALTTVQFQGKVSLRAGWVLTIKPYNNKYANTSPTDTSKTTYLIVDLGCWQNQRMDIKTIDSASINHMKSMNMKMCKADETLVSKRTMRGIKGSSDQAYKHKVFYR